MMNARKSRFDAAVVALVAPVAILVLAQGGFFPLVPCAVGLGLSVAAGIAWWRARRSGWALPRVALLLCALVLAYALSAMANGLTLTTLSETGMWAASAAYVCLACAVSAETRVRSLAGIAWFCVLTAVAGVLVATKAWPLAGGMVEERLQFSFQYANAAAAWYGVCTLLCALGSDARLSACAALPATALLLTQSGGGLVAFALVVGCVCVYWIQAGRWDALRSALVQAVMAAALFVAVLLLRRAAALVVLAGVCALCAWMACNAGAGQAAPWVAASAPAAGCAGEGAKGRVSARVGDRGFALVLMGVLALAMLGSAVLLKARVAAALASFAERLYHVRDGVALTMRAPLLGVGPNNWQYLYHYIQSAPYNTTVIHSSPVQILVDAGFLGFGLFVGACTVGLRGQVRNLRAGAAVPWAAARLAATAFLLGHTLLEFDLQFASLAFFLGLLLVGEDGAALARSNAQLRTAPYHKHALRVRALCLPLLGGRAACLLCALLLAPACLLGAGSAALSTALAAANEAGDYAAVDQLFHASVFARADVTAEGDYLAALCAQNELTAAVEAYGRMAAPRDGDAVNAALAHYRLRDVAGATQVLVERLEAQPYNIAFCTQAEELARTYGTDPEQAARLNAAFGRVHLNASR